MTIEWKRFVCAAGLMLLPALAWAQDSSDKPPVPRLVQAPDAASWTVTYKYTNPDPYPKTSNPIDAAIYDRMRKEHPRIVSAVTEKSGMTKKEVDRYADGSETVIWMVGDIMVTNARPYHRLVTLNAKLAEIPFQHDFYDLEWINKATYKGRQDYHGAQCWSYEGTADQSGKLTVYVDVKSGLPAAIEREDGTANYAFSPGGGALEIPPEIEKEIRGFKTGQAVKPY